LIWFQENFIYNGVENHKPSFWSVYERTINLFPRTINSLEGYHAHLNSIASTKHPNLLGLIDELKNEQLLIEKCFVKNILLYSKKEKNKNRMLYIVLLVVLMNFMILSF
jgi:hypothetical protein